tara:strand:+ start:12677 stop:13069 length:393 start_codon:yes stop_codon:yes gene_type:complete
MRKTWISIIALISLSSCEKIKGVEGREDIEGPNITIFQPQVESFRSNDTLKIEVLFSDNNGLHDVYIGLNDMTVGLKRIHWSLHEHGLNAKIDTFYVFPSYTGSKEYVLQIESSDHNNNRCSTRKPLFLN